MLPAAAGAATLTYDTPTVTVTVGQSVDVGVTLTLDAGVGLSTDATGSASFSTIDGLGNPQTGTITYSVYQQSFLGFFGTPAGYFSSDTSFMAAVPNPLANLTLLPGGSVHLVPGTITTLAGLPIGTYTTDIGIVESCISGSCFFLVFAPPNYADAGTLTLNVMPEPLTLALLPGAFATLALLRRRVG